MSANTICKTVHQYSNELIAEMDMKKLQEIASDYSKVKNYVYTRFWGPGSLPKLYPGYTVQNEMTACGLRDDLGLPSVYFYLAVFEALGDIKSQWTRTKSKILKLVRQNENFTEAEKHYLRFALKVSNVFIAILTQEPLGYQELPPNIQNQYDILASQVDIGKLHRYLCRQVRKYHLKLHTERADGFSISERAYRYDGHGIYISTKEKRKRIFIPLTDQNQYRKQLYIKLYPKEKRIEIKAAIDVAVHSHPNYVSRLGISLGMFTMLVTHEGHKYGEQLGMYHIRLTEWTREQNMKYMTNREENSERKKYKAKKHRLNEQLHSYINQELNRFIQIEQPAIIYLPKLPQTNTGGVVKRINYSVTMWQRGYIKSRLVQKCREHSIEFVEVFGKDIGNECSSCGAIGSKKDRVFSCPSCGFQEEYKINSARNARKRGESNHKSCLSDE